MLNKFPLWKNLLVVGVLLISLVYALPNVFGDDPSVQVVKSGVKVSDNALADSIRFTLAENGLNYKSMEPTTGGWVVRFADAGSQLKAKDIIAEALNPEGTGPVSVASSLAPATPNFLRTLGAEPMKYGLDLRGGVHFLISVDVNSVVKRRLQGDERNLAAALRKERLRYSRLQVVGDKQLIVSFKHPDTLDQAFRVAKRELPELNLQKNVKGLRLQGTLSESALKNIREYTIEQTMTTLRKRVNELGVAEAAVQQVGPDRIGVDLPGIQDTSRAKKILGGTATLEFHMVDIDNDARSAKASGQVPPGTRLMDFDGQPYLVKNQVLLTGDSITFASATIGEDGRPAVSIRLGGGGEALFARETRRNVGKPMGTVFIETKAVSKMVDGKLQTKTYRVERLINVATIRSALTTHFQVTGLSSASESRNLALQLRAGAAPATISIIEERIVGPSLGLENINKGVMSVEAGFILVVLLMALYYRTFGVIADLALIFNLVVIVALMSVLGATLTLPGIAGIVLTLGMAVDANVLIFERIREELRNGLSPQASIHAGFERAFSTIVDANVTTLVVAVVLFGIGSGPIKGFAVTLTIGLITSMFTAITCTRSLVNWLYGGKPNKKLNIGITVNS